MKLHAQLDIDCRFCMLTRDVFVHVSDSYHVERCLMIVASTRKSPPRPTDAKYTSPHLRSQ
jgi:hypothetical protein